MNCKNNLVKGVKAMKKRFRKALTATLVIAMLSVMLLTSTSVSAYGPLTMYTPPSSAPSYGVLSPRTVQLKYSGSNNGKMYTTFEECSNGVPTFPIFESTNNGQTWTKVGDVRDTQNGWGMLNCPQLFEMPQTIGSLTAGTLICAGNSVPGDRSATRMDLYKSTDLGRTWTFVSRIATGGRHAIEGDPIWEPWFLVANNKLICYYSDERDPAHSQKLVHQTTTNGTTWSAVVDDVVWPDSTTRPGMPIVVKLSNGNYMMTYEVVGQSGVPCYAKINNNPETGWNACTSTKIANGGSSYVTMLSDGRILAQTYGSGDIYFNTKNDGTGSWVAMGTPTGAAYNRCLLPLSNGRLFIVCGGGFVAPNHNSITYADMWVPPITGSYRLVNVKSGKVLGINGGSTADGAQAVQWTSNGSYDQMWQRVNLTGGYTKLIDVKTSKALGVYQGSTAEGAKVVQWNDTGALDQQWTFVAVGSNYKIVNRNSGKCLGVWQGSTAEGAELVQWTDNGSTDQQWQLVAN